jgi:hypothetical protein
MFQATEGTRAEKGMWFPQPWGQHRAIGQISEEPAAGQATFMSLGKWDWVHGKIATPLKPVGPIEDTDNSLRLDKITTWRVAEKGRVGTEEIEIDSSVEIAGILLGVGTETPELEVLKTHPHTGLAGQIVELTGLRLVDQPSAFTSNPVSGGVGSSGGCTCSGTDCQALGECAVCCAATGRMTCECLKIVTCPLWCWFAN